VIEQTSADVVAEQVVRQEHVAAFAVTVGLDLALGATRTLVPSGDLPENEGVGLWTR
jgi:hypothetical protein